MKKILLITAGILVFFAFISTKNYEGGNETAKINSLLDKWHKDAAEAKYDNYFDALNKNGVFIGTDATENWTKQAFEAYAKPYFDKGKTWKFKRIERHVYLNHDKTVAWFDELLDTQMKICRGSGVLLRQNGEWKIAHYVLSMTVPNENTDEVVKLKSPIEDQVIEKINNLK